MRRIRIVVCVFATLFTQLAFAQLVPDQTDPAKPVAYVYVASSGVINAFAAGFNGQLTPVPGSPFHTASGTSRPTAPIYSATTTSAFTRTPSPAMARPPRSPRSMLSNTITAVLMPYFSTGPAPLCMIGSTSAIPVMPISSLVPSLPRAL